MKKIIVKINMEFILKTITRLDIMFIIKIVAELNKKFIIKTAIRIDIRFVIETLAKKIFLKVDIYKQIVLTKQNVIVLL